MKAPKAYVACRTIDLSSFASVDLTLLGLQFVWAECM
jgi:hypothetical protein